MNATIEADLLKSMSAKEQADQQNTRNKKILQSIRRRQRLYGLPNSLALRYQKQVSGNIDFKKFKNLIK